MFFAALAITAAAARGLPSRVPRAFAAAKAALVRCEIILRSAARMWMVSRLAVGISTATNSTSLFINPEMKCTFRARRSQLGDHQHGAALPALGKRGGKLGPVILPPATSTNCAVRSPL